MTVDANVYNEPPDIGALFPYLPEYLVEHFTHAHFTGPYEFDYPYPPKSGLAVRPETRVGGRVPGLAEVQSEILDRGADHAVLLCTYPIDSLRNPDYAAALASAINDWQIAEWLNRDERLRASIVVPAALPELAAAEIERVGDHPGFVQVGLPVRSERPWGSRLYHPMWRAMAERNLVGGIYFGGAPGNPSTAVGWPSYFIEEYVGMASVFASQVANLVMEGLFDKFDSLRLTLFESGISWLGPHLWRVDKEWKQLRLTVPWVRKAPSKYVLDHLRLSIAPLDVPADADTIHEVLEPIDGERMLLYASGYPHARGGSAGTLLSSLREDDVRRRLMSGNACAWYRNLAA